MPTPADTTAANISKMSNTARENVNRVTERLDVARSLLAQIIAADDAPAGDVALFGEKAISAIDRAMDLAGRTQAEIDAANTASIEQFRNVPLDAGTRATAESAARQAAQGKVMAAKAPMLTSAAAAAAASCAELELYVGYASTLLDPDLVVALDGEFTMASQASDAYLGDYFAGLAMAEVAAFYDKLRRGERDFERVARVERVLLTVANARITMTPQELLVFTKGRGRDLGEADRTAARAIKRTIEQARASRCPAWVSIAGDLVGVVGEAFRRAFGLDASLVATFDKAAVAAIQSPAALAEARRPWAVQERFYHRFVPTLASAGAKK